MKPLVVLGEVGLLRHEAHAGIEVERLPHDAQHDLGCMDIVFVFGVSAQILIEIGVDGAVGLEVGVPGAEIGSPICGRWNVECGRWNVECGRWNVECGRWNVECGMREGAEVVGGAVALVVLVLILIAELEVDLAEDGFAVGRTKAVAPVLRGGLTITLDDL